MGDMKGGDLVGQWLEERSSPPSQIELGLTRIRAVKDAMRLAPAAPIITVGGTNGKGSVCAYLQSILTAGGFRVGAYFSPHVFRFNERAQINAEPLPDDVLLNALQTADAAARRAGVNLTYFELATLGAVAALTQAQCEALILEVGLGGRLDAVNIFDPDVAVITNVQMDHAEFLGDSRAAIAAEKAAIARADKPAVIGCADSAALLRPHLDAIGAQTAVFGRDFSAETAGATGRAWHFVGARPMRNLPLPQMMGRHQIANAATAIAALARLPPQFLPGFGAAREGLHQARLPARAQVLPGEPVTVVDVAHNPAAAAALERFLFEMGFYPQTRAVLGMQPHKDIAGFVRALAKRVDHWHIAAPEGVADADAAVSAMVAAVAAIGGKYETHESITEAALATVVADDVEAARAVKLSVDGATGSSAMDNADGKSDRIIVVGSFLTVADFFRNCYNGGLWQSGMMTRRA